MTKKRLDVKWDRGLEKDDIKPSLKRYERYLEDNGLRASTIPMYVLHVSKYLEFSATDSPSADDFARFHGITPGPIAESQGWRRDSGRTPGRGELHLCVIELFTFVIERFLLHQRNDRPWLRFLERSLHLEA